MRLASSEDRFGVDFFEGFSWAVPRALSGAVAACRFEQGDVLYSDPCGYDRWPGGGRDLRFQLQVLAPPKTARALSSEQQGGRFSANWNSPVEFELSDRSKGHRSRRTSSQGRVFSCLWHGTTDWLDEDRPDPPEPAGQRELHGRLGQAKEFFERHFSSQGMGPFCVYLSAVDEASDAARLKAQTVETGLRERFGELVVHSLLPGPAELDPSGEIHPALRVRGIAISSADSEAIEQCLRDVLYVGTGSPATRFSVSRHGQLWGPVGA